MALVHDIAEAIVGDITPYCSVSAEEKHRREADAIQQIKGMLGLDTDAGAQGPGWWWGCCCSLPGGSAGVRRQRPAGAALPAAAHHPAAHPIHSSRPAHPPPSSLAPSRAAAKDVEALWREYEGASSPEALLVKDFDKVEMIVTVGCWCWGWAGCW